MLQLGVYACGVDYGVENLQMLGSRMEARTARFAMEEVHHVVLKAFTQNAIGHDPDTHEP